MNLRTTYPYDLALDDLTAFLENHVHDERMKTEFMEYLDLCRESKTVTFRYIHEKYMKYRKDASVYDKHSESEKEMIEDLFHFWG